MNKFQPVEGSIHQHNCILSKATFAEGLHTLILAGLDDNGQYRIAVHFDDGSTYENAWEHSAQSLAMRAVLVAVPEELITPSFLNACGFEQTTF